MPRLFHCPDVHVRWPTIFGLCLVFFLSGCGNAPGSKDSAGGPAAKKELPELTGATYRVELKSWPTVVKSFGSLIADEVAVVGSRIDGRISDVHVDLGDRVDAESLLVKVGQAEFRLLVEQAEAQLLQARSAVGLRPGDPVEKLNPENAPPVVEAKALWNEAKANLDRARRLQDRQSITAFEIEQMEASEAVTEARHRSALNSVLEKIALIHVREAELSLARERLADTEIKSPFDGFVQEKRVSPGTYVRVGDPVATIVRTDRLRFRGTIPERYALSLTAGQPVELKIESVHSPLTVQVSRISPAVDLSSRALVFEATVDNSDGALRSGLFAEASVVTDPNSTAIIIPASALVEFAGAEKVWKITNGEVREQQVLTGTRRPEGIEILQGLSADDEILLEGMAGMTARFVRKKADSELHVHQGESASEGPSDSEKSSGPLEPTESSEAVASAASDQQNSTSDDHVETAATEVDRESPLDKQATETSVESSDAKPSD